MDDIEFYFFTDKLIVNRQSMVEFGKEFDNLFPFETFNMTYDWESITHYSNKAFRKPFTLHRGSSSICWVLVRDLAIDMHFFGVIGFLWIKSTSYDGP